ncbi:MAG: hypothetical protein ABI475_00710 [Methylophilaceae bacterium]
MPILISASAQTPHRMLCVVGARPNFAMPEEINRILTNQITDPLSTCERSGGMTGKVPEIRHVQASTHTATRNYC